MKKLATRWITSFRPPCPNFYPGPMATGENLFSHHDARNLLRYGGMRPRPRLAANLDCALSYGSCGISAHAGCAGPVGLVAPSLHSAMVGTRCH